MYERRISANERLYVAGGKVFSKLVIQHIIEGQGDIDSDALKRAIKQVSVVMPGTTLRMGPKSKWLANGELPELIESQHYPDIRFDFTDAFNIDHPHYPNTLDPVQGRTCEIVLCKQHQRSLLIFRVLHAVMDGKGLALWVDNIFRGLRGDALIPTESTMVDDQVLKEQNAPFRSDEPKIPKCEGPKANTSGNLNSFNFYRYRINTTEPAIVSKLCSSIQSLFVNGDRSKYGKVMIPVDIRNGNIESQTSSANLSLPIFIDLEPSKTWLNYQCELLKKINQQKYLEKGNSDVLYRLLPSGMLSFLLKYLWRHQTKRGHYFVNAAISHLGKRSHAELATAKFYPESVINIPCPIPIAPLSLVVSEFDGHTEICMVTSTQLFGQPQDLLLKLLTTSGFTVDQMTNDAFSPSLEDKKAKREVGEFNLVYSSLHALFELQTQQSQDQICVVEGANTYSYNVVNQRANQLAHYLGKIGVSPGDFIGVASSGSITLVVSILATLKCGGVFVPLEPSLPAKRLNFIVKDSQLKFILCQEEYAKLFEKSEKVISLNENHEAFSSQMTLNPMLKVGKKDPCYVIYTSGTTGTPKGSITHHGGAVNYFVWLINALGLCSQDSSLQKTPISFDASLMDIFLPILCGGKLVLCKPGAHKDIDYLSHEINKYKISIFCAVPIVMEMLLNKMQTDNSPLSSLKHMVIGGEVFSGNLHSRMIEHYPEATIINSYGPSECSISTLYFDASHQTLSSTNVPIGRAVPNNIFHLVNDNGNSVLDGEQGELIVTGEGIGLGYINRPELNEEKLYKESNGLRSYKTGDLVERQKDGNISFISRLDSQVKFRGVRIELEEIEHCINQIKQIEKSIVAVFTPASGQASLAAFYITNTTCNISDQGIQRALASDLPDYMIPRVFCQVDALPQNASGKIDRNMLIRHLKEQKNPMAPPLSNPLEEKLATLWKSYIGQPVTSLSHFFYLGGDSLMAVSLMISINKEFNTDLDPAVFYEYPIFQDFAKILEQKLEQTHTCNLA